MNHMKIPTKVACGLAMVAMGALAFVPSGVRAESRGELLYTTHCVACHTEQQHWRDKKLASDWLSLKAQVQRWQATALLAWKEDDVVEVTRYLNDRFYGFKQTNAITGLDPEKAR
jgi:mono/diheme cytochrome c family protein